jgi:hypothetical protein
MMGVLAQVENGDQFWKLKSHATNEGFVFLLFGQPTKNGGLIFYCGTSMGVGDSLGIPTGLGLQVWVLVVLWVFPLG